MELFGVRMRRPGGARMEKPSQISLLALLSLAACVNDPASDDAGERPIASDGSVIAPLNAALPAAVDAATPAPEDAAMPLPLPPVVEPADPAELDGSSYFVL